MTDMIDTWDRICASSPLGQSLAEGSLISVGLVRDMWTDSPEGVLQSTWVNTHGDALIFATAEIKEAGGRVPLVRTVPDTPVFYLPGGRYRYAEEMIEVMYCVGKAGERLRLGGRDA